MKRVHLVMCCLLAAARLGAAAVAQTPTPMAQDMNRDGVVDHRDLFRFQACWHFSTRPTATAGPTLTPTTTPERTPTPTVNPGATSIDLADYLPLRVGNSWLYDRDGDQVALRVHRIERIGPYDCWILGDELGASQQAFSWYADTLYLVRESLEDYGLTLTYDPPIEIGNHSMSIGARFTTSPTFEGDVQVLGRWYHFTGTVTRQVTYDRTGDVTVPAGSYSKALHVEVDDELEVTVEGLPTESGTSSERDWLARDVGMVWQDYNGDVMVLVSSNVSAGKPVKTVPAATGALPASPLARQILELVRRAVE